MRIEEKLKITLTILVIVLISLASFGGIYLQKMKFVENILPEYQLGMDLKGGRSVDLSVDTTVNTVIYDKDGKVVEEEGKDTTKKEVPVNDKEVLTTENYKKSKEIVEKRLKEMKVSDYTIRYDSKTGKMSVKLPENNNTDTIAQYMATKGTFTIVNDNEDVLLNNSHLKNAQVGYSTTETGTAVYLTIQFNKEGTEIFKNITNEYVATQDEEGKETTKKITLKIDESTLLNTYFESEISNGTLQLSIGRASTDASTVQGYIREASNIAVLLNTGDLPITYTISDNLYVMSDITKDVFYIPAIILGVILLIGIVFLIIKYKKNGLLASIALIGYIATLLLVLRYANVELTMEGIIGIVVAIAMDFIFTIYLLGIMKHSDSKTIAETSQNFKEALIKTLFIFVPAIITAVILCFAGWLPIYSFGMVMFWGLLLIVLYNLVFTRTLIVDTKKNK